MIRGYKSQGLIINVDKEDTPALKKCTDASDHLLGYSMCDRIVTNCSVCQRPASMGYRWMYGQQVDYIGALIKYSWIGHRVQSGPALLFSLWLSDLKNKTSFRFLIKKMRGRFLFFQKVKK